MVDVDEIMTINEQTDNVPVGNVPVRIQLKERTSYGQKIRVLVDLQGSFAIYIRGAVPFQFKNRTAAEKALDKFKEGSVWQIRNPSFIERTQSTTDAR